MREQEFQSARVPVADLLDPLSGDTRSVEDRPLTVAQAYLEDEEGFQVSEEARG